MGSDETEGEEDFDQFALDQLETTSDWYGLSMADLEGPTRAKFFGYELSVRFLNTSDEEELKEVFRRLNRFTVPLSHQELRHATYEGPFARLAQRLADDLAGYFAENRIVTAASIRRMGDVELVAELLVGTMLGPQAGSPRAIDELYATYEDYETEFPGQRKSQAAFTTATDAVQLLGDLRDVRWSNKTDFYSVFVAFGHYVRQGGLPTTNARITRLRKALFEFGAKVDLALANDKAKVSIPVRTYVRNVEKGANDKARRAERHAVLIELMLPHLG
jgi:hypothetical protein